MPNSTDNHDNNTTNNPLEGMLDAGQACEFLTELWELKEPYQTTAFKTLRQRLNIKPDAQVSNNTFWRIETLRQIPKPQRGNPRNRKKSAGRQPSDPSPDCGAGLIVLAS